VCSWVECFEREGAAKAIQRMQRHDQEHLSTTKKLRACTGRYGPSLKASLERLRTAGLTGGSTTARLVANSIELMQRCLAEMWEIGSPPVEFGRNDPPVEPLVDITPPLALARCSSFGAKSVHQNEFFDNRGVLTTALAHRSASVPNATRAMS